MSAVPDSLAATPPPIPVDPAAAFAAAMPAERVEHRFEFRGTAREYFPIWIVNLCLGILTLGVYSAWAKVRTQRYFYGNTSLAGAHFDYLGQPLPILKGRLVAVAMLVVATLAGYLLEYGTLLMFAVIGVIAPWIIVRALRFRAHNSAWRSLRFQFAGGTSGSYTAFALNYLMLIPTLGFGYAWVKTRQREYVLRNHRFGGQRFALSLEWTDLFKIYFIAGLVVFALNKVAEVATLIAGIDADTILPDDPRFWPWFVLSMLWTLMVFGTALTYLSVRLFNLTWNCASLGRHRFRATQSVADVLGLRLVNALAIVATLGLALPWAKIRMARYRAAHFALLAEGSLEDFVADERAQASAVGEEVGEAFSIDLGL